MRQAVPKSNSFIGKHAFYGYDVWLAAVVFFMVCLGLIMVASASISVAEKQIHQPLYYFWRQLLSVAIGFSIAIIIIKIPMIFWQKISPLLLFFSFVLLVIVLIPGIGYEVNGSMRWINTRPFLLQASEPVKFFMIAYLAGYMVRRSEEVKTSFSGFVKPIIILTALSSFLLLEPDYGACVVLFGTALGMLFLGGVPLSRFFSWVSVAVTALAAIAILSPYRMQRLISFVDPWQDPFNSGFQLTQALIAFGRGNWFGVGLGSSIQKLFYLPEAHTDFVFAVLAEELGLVGSLLLILLFSFLVWRAFMIGQVAQSRGDMFSAYFAYGIGLLLGGQAFINLGVNMGVLPTKGLTLPLISYGGNSMIITCTLLAILLRVEFENRNCRRLFKREAGDYAT